jgi:3-phenylpropionate/trans-cinnamate dioxygenase ferredoxin component
MSIAELGLERYIDVAAADDIPGGEGRCYQVEGVSVAVFHEEGVFYAVSDTCTHESYSLAEGVVWDHTVECPQHGARFDLVTGDVLSLPATLSIESYPIEVRDGRIFVAVPADGHREPCPECHTSAGER